MRPYIHFTHLEREKLQIALILGKSLREIAREMGRNVSSVSRELKRNANKDGSYTPYRGTSLYLYRRKRCRRSYRLENDCALRSFVENGLRNFWSPEIIVARWKRENMGAPLGIQTIYRALYRGILKGFPPKKYLRRYSNHPMPKGPNYATIHPEHRIHDRPQVANLRKRLGDWEGDTVRGKSGTGCLLTLIDRKSRFLCAALCNTSSSTEILEAFQTALDGQMVKSITLDRGSEFARFKDIEQQQNATVYFADARSPWQRGSNEKINGLIRFWFPKGTRFKEVLPSQLQVVLSLINNRPRKCFNWLSPIEFLAMCCT